MQRKMAACLPCHLLLLLDSADLWTLCLDAPSHQFRFTFSLFFFLLLLLLLPQQTYTERFRSYFLARAVRRRGRDSAGIYDLTQTSPLHKTAICVD